MGMAVRSNSRRPNDEGGFELMLVIYRARSWEVISCPQDISEAWELAELLETQTGVRHYVGRV